MTTTTHNRMDNIEVVEPLEMLYLKNIIPKSDLMRNCVTIATELFGDQLKDGIVQSVTQDLWIKYHGKVSSDAVMDVLLGSMGADVETSNNLTLYLVDGDARGSHVTHIVTIYDKNKLNMGKFVNAIKSIGTDVEDMEEHERENLQLWHYTVGDGVWQRFVEGSGLSSGSCSSSTTTLSNNDVIKITVHGTEGGISTSPENCSRACNDLVDSVEPEEPSLMSPLKRRRLIKGAEVAVDAIVADVSEPTVATETAGPTPAPPPSVLRLTVHDAVNSCNALSGCVVELPATSSFNDLNNLALDSLELYTILDVRLSSRRQLRSSSHICLDDTGDIVSDRETDGGQEEVEILSMADVRSGDEVWVQYRAVETRDRAVAAVGPKCNTLLGGSSEFLAVELSDCSKTFTGKIAELCGLFRTARKIKGDGNCYFRCLVVALLEQYLCIAGYARAALAVLTSADNQGAKSKEQKRFHAEALAMCRSRVCSLCCGSWTPEGPSCSRSSSRCSSSSGGDSEFPVALADVLTSEHKERLCAFVEDIFGFGVNAEDCGDVGVGPRAVLPLQEAYTRMFELINDPSSGVDELLVRLCRFHIGLYIYKLHQAEMEKENCKVGSTCAGEDGKSGGANSGEGSLTIGEVISANFGCSVQDFLAIVCTMGEDAEDVMLAQAPRALGCRVITYLLDRRDNVDLVYVDSGDGDGDGSDDSLVPASPIEYEPLVHVLYRPGHYDVLYRGAPEVEKGGGLRLEYTNWEVDAALGAEFAASQVVDNPPITLSESESESESEFREREVGRGDRVDGDKGGGELPRKRKRVTVSANSIGSGTGVGDTAGDDDNGWLEAARPHKSQSYVAKAVRKVGNIFGHLRDTVTSVLGLSRGSSSGGLSRGSSSDGLARGSSSDGGAQRGLSRGSSSDGGAQRAAGKRTHRVNGYGRGHPVAVAQAEHQRHNPYDVAVAQAEHQRHNPYDVAQAEHQRHNPYDVAQAEHQRHNPYDGLMDMPRSPSHGNDGGRLHGTPLSTGRESFRNSNANAVQHNQSAVSRMAHTSPADPPVRQKIRISPAPAPTPADQCLVLEEHLGTSIRLLKEGGLANELLALLQGADELAVLSLNNLPARTVPQACTIADLRHFKFRELIRRCHDAPGSEWVLDLPVVCATMAIIDRYLDSNFDESARAHLCWWAQLLARSLKAAIERHGHGGQSDADAAFTPGGQSDRSFAQRTGATAEFSRVGFDADSNIHVDGANDEAMARMLQDDADAEAEADTDEFDALAMQREAERGGRVYNGGGFSARDMKGFIVPDDQIEEEAEWSEAGEKAGYALTSRRGSGKNSQRNGSKSVRGKAKPQPNTPVDARSNGRVVFFDDDLSGRNVTTDGSHSGERTFGKYTHPSTSHSNNSNNNSNNSNNNSNNNNNNNNNNRDRWRQSEQVDLSQATDDDDFM